jgi:hypothetical protein
MAPLKKIGAETEQGWHSALSNTPHGTDLIKDKEKPLIISQPSTGSETMEEHNRQGDEQSTTRMEEEGSTHLTGTQGKMYPPSCLPGAVMNTRRERNFGNKKQPITSVPPETAQGNRSEDMMETDITQSTMDESTEENPFNTKRTRKLIPRNTKRRTATKRGIHDER